MGGGVWEANGSLVVYQKSDIGWDRGNVFKDWIKGSEDPGSRSFFRILIGIWTALRIGRKDLDPFLGYSNKIPIQHPDVINPAISS